MLFGGHFVRAFLNRAYGVATFGSQKTTESRMTERSKQVRIYVLFAVQYPEIERDYLRTLTACVARVTMGEG